MTMIANKTNPRRTVSQSAFTQALIEAVNGFPSLEGPS
jgi:hypothetical protein